MKKTICLIIGIVLVVCTLFVGCTNQIAVSPSPAATLSLNPSSSASITVSPSATGSLPLTPSASGSAS